jgi:hypothetical protein
MGYLQFALLTPAIGIFPFSMVLGAGAEYSLSGLVLVNLANIVVILMLLFLAYPLSFFGSRVPDRVVKTELLRFFLRGPGTALLALVTVLYTVPASRILGLPGQSFTPFAVVAVVLLWQWMVHLILPILEKRLVYSGEDYDRLERLENLSDRLLTRSDLIQLLEAILASTCDYLRVATAFAVSLTETEPELIAAIGPTRPSSELLRNEVDDLYSLLHGSNNGELIVHKWQSYWIIPLVSTRNAERRLIGFMALQARAAEIDLTIDDEHMLHSLARRAEQTMDDMSLQTDLIAALEGLLPQISITAQSRDELEFVRGRPGLPAIQPAPILETEQFKERVWAALKHYYGGPGMSNSRLLELKIVKQALPENDNNPVKALRAVLNKAIEAQRPNGERKVLSPEWTLYNILEMRFIKGAKVKEVVTKLAMSEPDFYRKQSFAVTAIATTLRDWEEAGDSQS